MLASAVERYRFAWAAHALLDDLSPAARLHRGTAVAAFAVATPGDWQGLPTHADLDLPDLQPGSTVRRR